MYIMSRMPQLVYFFVRTVRRNNVGVLASRIAWNATHCMQWCLVLGLLLPKIGMRGRTRTETGATSKLSDLFLCCDLCFNGILQARE